MVALKDQKIEQIQEIAKKDNLYDQLMVDAEFLPDLTDKEDEEMIQIVKALFNCRRHQLSQMKFFRQQSERAAVIVWPCAAGKTHGLEACAKYMHHLHPKKRIYVVVPRESNQMTALVKLGQNQDSDVGKAGVFVVTFNQFLKKEDKLIKNQIVLLDEFHFYIHQTQGQLAL